MATPARKARARRPFAVVASPPPPPSSARNRVVPPENACGPQGTSFAQCLRRFKKFSGEPSPVAMAPFTAGRAAKNKKCCSSPVSRKPALRTPRTSSRRRVDSSRRVSTPAVAAAAYDAPRAPLWDFSDEGQKVRARLSSPYDEADQGQERRCRRSDGDGGARGNSRKRTMGSVALEEAMAGLPEPGDGRVRYLVDTFEKLLSLPGDAEARSRSGGARRRRRKGATKTGTMPSSWPPPPPHPKAEEIDMSYPSIASSSDASFNVGSAFSDSNRRSSARDHQLQQQKRRCSSFGSLERKATGPPPTSQYPFNLRTEQRGRVKVESLVQRMRKQLLEEERLRYPLAQGLPWTTDEPENTAKPPTKEPTEPFDVVLHSEVRAFGRARFDHQVAERSSFFDKLEMERERQRKLDEEIEVKQLRKEQVPRAHPMPDFSRPFVPKRSVKPQTVPREPRFQLRLMRHNHKA